MLELVGNPVVVNPDTPLAQIAKQRGWRVMRFEKLGRRLAVAGTVAGAAAIGGSGTWLAARRGASRGYTVTRRRPRSTAARRRR
jgi:hypothetical protein